MEFLQKKDTELLRNLITSKNEFGYLTNLYKLLMMGISSFKAKTLTKHIVAPFVVKLLLYKKYIDRHESNNNNFPHLLEEFFSNNDLANHCQHLANFHDDFKN